MGYYSVPKERWQEFLDIEDEAIPRKLIIEGHIDFPRCIEERSRSLEHARVAWMPNLIHGKHEGQTIAYGVCFGGPIASQFTHIYCKLGTVKVILIGICGGLQADMDLGDVIVSEGVRSMDGSARLYKHDSGVVAFDMALRDRAVEEMGRRSVRFHVGRTVSYFDILLEETEDLVSLSRSGYVGVEMEAAAVAAAATHFGTPAISLLAVSDNSISGKDLFYEQQEEERERVRRARDVTFDVALGL
jgi:purine-nucleoside phosphorylase